MHTLRFSAQAGRAKMAKSDNTKREKGAFFSRNHLKLLAISVVVSTVLGGLVDSFHAKDGELAALRASAYAAVTQFTPWNFFQRYAQIVATQGNGPDQLAEQQHRLAEAFRGVACSQDRMIGQNEAGDTRCTPLPPPHGIHAFYLSAHVPLILRFVTAFFDLLLHALIDQGVIGFLVAAAQLIIGVLLMRLVIQRRVFELKSLYSYIVFVPLLVLALSTASAIPLWLLARIWITVFNGLPAAGIGVQATCTAFLVALCSKTVEEVGHDAIMRQAERIIGD